MLLGGWAIAGAVWWTVDLGLSPVRLVLLGTVMALVTTFAEAPTGVIADVFGRRRAILSAWTLMGVAQLLSPVSEHLLVLCVWQVLWALGFALHSGADTAWVTDEIGVEDDGLVVRFGFAMSVGILVGVSAAIAMTRWSVPVTMSTFGVLSLAFTAWLATTMNEEGFEPGVGRDVVRWTAMRTTWSTGFGVVRAAPVLAGLVLAMMFVGAEADAVNRLDLVRLRELGFPSADGRETVLTFGIAWMVMVVVGLPFQWWTAVKVTADSAMTPRLAVLTLVAAGVGLGALLGGNLVVALVGLGVREVSTNSFAALGAAWINHSAPSAARATVHSFLNLAQGVGRAVGGLGIAVVAELVSVRVGFVVALACMGSAAVVAAATLTASERGHLAGVPDSGVDSNRPEVGPV